MAGYFITGIHAARSWVSGLSTLGSGEGAGLPDVCLSQWYESLFRCRTSPTLLIAIRAQIIA